MEDPNTYAMGGVSGHAGVFATAPDLLRLMRSWLFAPNASALLNSTTTALFTREFNQSQSSRALGWNTNDGAAFDQGWNFSCGSLSPRTFMHTGYTGTMLCGDPTRNLAIVLLTNRVYPADSEASKIAVHDTRRQFATAVQIAYDAWVTATTNTETADGGTSSLVALHSGGGRHSGG